MTAFERRKRRKFGFQFAGQFVFALHSKPRLPKLEIEATFERTLFFFSLLKLSTSEKQNKLVSQNSFRSSSICAQLTT